MQKFAVTFYKDTPASGLERIRGIPGHWPALIEPWAPSKDEPELVLPRVLMTQLQLSEYMQTHMPEYLAWEQSLPPE